MSTKKIAAAAIALLVLPTCLLAEPATTDHSTWTPLLDKELSQWEVWIGVPHETVQGLPEGTPKSKDGKKGTPLGLNNDPLKVFSVIEEDGEPVLAISGVIFGGLTTKKSYENYHFSVQMKWGEKKYEPRLTIERDTGILYHCTGEHGAFWNVWKTSIECQICEGQICDLYLLGGKQSGRPSAQVTTAQDEKIPVWNPAGKLGPAKGRTRASENLEKPHGEWNTVEVYTIGDEAVHVLNGRVVMHLTNVRLKDKPLTSGQIQIQSEAAEAYYRDIKIQPITAFPESILAQLK